MASGQQEKLFGVQFHTSALWSFSQSITHKSEAPFMQCRKINVLSPHMAHLTQNIPNAFKLTLHPKQESQSEHLHSWVVLKSIPKHISAHMLAQESWK